MKALTFVNFAMISELTWPEVIEKIDLYSSALNIFTNFKEAPPRVIEASVRAHLLVDIMKKEHVRLKLVVDDSNHFLGVISLEDLSEEVFVKHVAAGFSRDELIVADVMRYKADLLALSYDSLKKSDIESLIISQRHNSYQHLLVVDESTKQVCGLISANDIARQLRVESTIGSSSFKHLYEKLIQAPTYSKPKMAEA